VNKTVFLFEMQVKAAIFHQMKSDYERISTFKGNQSIKLCTSVISAWRLWAQEKARLRAMQEDHHSSLVIGRFQKLL
jgi:hypothetical protein